MEMDNSLLSRICIFCCKSFSPPVIVSPQNGGSLDNGNKNRILFARFLKLLQQYSGVWKDCKHLKELLPVDHDLSEQDENDANNNLKVETCPVCAAVMTSFCEIYHEKETLNLQVQWKLQTLISLMTHADRVASRRKFIRETYGMKENGNYANFINTRKEIIQIGSLGISHSFPRVYLENLDASPRTTCESQGKLESLHLIERKCTPQNDDTSKELLQQWVISFAAVVSLICPVFGKPVQCTNTLLETCRGVPVSDEVLFESDIDDFLSEDQPDNLDICSEVESTDNRSLVHNGSCVDSSSATEEFPEENYTNDDKKFKVENVCEDIHKSLCKAKSSKEELDLEGDHKKDCVVPSAIMLNTHQNVESLELVENENKLLRFRFCSEQLENKRKLTRQLKDFHASKRTINRHRASKSRRVFYCKYCRKIVSGCSSYVTHSKGLQHQRALKKKTQNFSVTAKQSDLSNQHQGNTTSITNWNTESVKNEIMDNKSEPVESNSIDDNGTKLRYNLRRRTARISVDTILADGDGSDSSHSHQESDSDKEFFSKNSIANSSGCSSSFSSASSEDEEESSLMSPQPRNKIKIEKNINDHQRSNYRFHRCMFAKCQFKTTSEISYEFHKRLHKPEKYQCNFCDAVEESAVRISMHEIMRHSKKNPCKARVHLCPQCPYETKSRFCYINHFAKVHLSIDFDRSKFSNCPICSVPVLNAEVHFKKVHDTSGIDPSKVLKCGMKNCSVQFTTLISRRRHQMNCHHKRDSKRLKPGERIKSHVFSCAICDKTFKKENGLLLHKRSALHYKEEEKTVSCQICKVMFFTKRSFNKHYQSNHSLHGRDPTTIEKCDQCKAYFLEKFQLAKHKRKCHQPGKSDDGRYKCTDCSKSYSDRRTLSRHRVNIHIGMLGSHSCDVLNCSRKFETSEDLLLHKKYFVHTLNHYSYNSRPDKNVEKVVCKVCSREFLGVGHLKIHMKVHKETRMTEFKCDLCDKVFKYKGHLKMHKEFHKGPEEWKFMCAICSKKCVSNAVLEQHMNTHTKTKRFVCQVCGEKYAHRHNLRIHVNSKHKEEGVEDIPIKQNRKHFVSRKGKKLTPEFCFTRSEKNKD